MPKKPSPVYKYTSVATKMGLIIAAGVYGGIKADAYFQFEKPWMTMLLSIVAVSLSIYVVIKDLTRES